jgi:hypothetical protein
MLPKPRRPREKRVVPLKRVTYSLVEFCERTGLGEKAVLRAIDAGSLRTVKVGHRQLILDQQASDPSANESITGFDS